MTAAFRCLHRGDVTRERDDYVQTENLNSRLRSDFFLRRRLGPDCLALLQFFLKV